MTNNDKELIKARLQGRDIEKLFDQFIEEASDAVIYDLGLAKLARNDDDLNDMIDYTIEQILARFGYKFVGKEE